MKASEAEQVANEFHEKKSHNLDEILSQILKEAKQGNYSMLYHHSISQDVFKDLVSLDYKVETVSFVRDVCYTYEISWNP